MEENKIPHSQNNLLRQLTKGRGSLCVYLPKERRAYLSEGLVSRQGLPVQVQDPVRWMTDQGYVDAESEGAWREFFDAIHAGQASASAMVTLKTKRGFGRYWLRMDTFSAEREEGSLVLITMDDFTATSRQFRLNEETMAQHTDRTVLECDLRTGLIYLWNQKERYAHLHEKPTAALFRFFPQESREKIEELLRQGQKEPVSGVEKIPIRNRKGERRWLDLKYSTLLGLERQPESLLFSFKDITEEYEHETAYRRYVQSLEHTQEHFLVIESDLTEDKVEKLGGQLLSEEERVPDGSHSDFGRMLDRRFTYVEDEASTRYFSIENLLKLYAQGQRNLRSQWQVRFSDETLHWLDTEVVLISDPYTDHIKGFFRMIDNTAEREEQLAVLHRSERDGMTGLYNRATAERKIREKLTGEEKGGILLLLDLDDLKFINDTFGHEEGDRAILGIAETLQSYFRESDVVSRIGGDEFMVYLPGAAEKQEAIAVSLATLLRRLTGISIGGREEDRRIHCSVGAAVQEPGESYESLFRRADRALYHVKRGSKNTFAFYTPEMEEENYSFKGKKFFSLQSARKFGMAELERLLDALAAFYPLIVWLNMSTNDYYLMEENMWDKLSPPPLFGRLDDYTAMILSMVHPEDKEYFNSKFSRKTLTEAYQRGEENSRCAYRLWFHGDWRWMEAAVLFYTSDNGDVCGFALVRWSDRNGPAPESR